MLQFRDAAAWETWLSAHNEKRAEAWLRIRKRYSAIALVTIADALDVALCYGWIDSHRRALDDETFLQRYSPRRPKSSWSKINAERAEELISAGRMRPAGLAEVERAKADGRWTAACEPQQTAEVPCDLGAPGWRPRG